MARREYVLPVTVNGRKILKVIIDDHYEEKHLGFIDDGIILELVRLLDNGTYPATAIDKSFEYYVVDHLKLREKYYKLIWLLEKDQLYIGVVNAYRRKK